jgi:hypothetical protein
MEFENCHSLCQNAEIPDSEVVFLYRVVHFCKVRTDNLESDARNYSGYAVNVLEGLLWKIHRLKN